MEHSREEELAKAAGCKAVVGLRETVEDGVADENFAGDARVEDEADCLREGEGAVPHCEDEGIPEGHAGKFGEEDVVENLDGGDEHRFVEGVEDDVRRAHVGGVAVNEEKRGEILEVDDGEIGGARGLLSFASLNTNSDLGFLNHRNVVATVSNT